MTVEIFFDFICPLCLIGKRNLEAAISRFAGSRPDVLLRVLRRSHQLLPIRPSMARLTRRSISNAWAVTRRWRQGVRRCGVQRAGSDAGIEFAFERIEVLPNTAAAHDLVAHAAGRAHAVSLRR